MESERPRMDDVEWRAFVKLLNIPADWAPILLDPEYVDELRAISEAVRDKPVLPPPELWFEWARLTPLNSIRAIIVGQDPYHTPGAAHGLAFSCLGRKQPSLWNILRCLEEHKLIKSAAAASGNLSPWARQGILLLNTAFSVEKGKAKSHAALWEVYFEHVLCEILIRYCGLRKVKLSLFLWGNAARDAVAAVLPSAATREPFNLYYCCHPSPFNGNKFLGCTHFSLLNEYLLAHGEKAICWDTNISQ